MWRKKSEEDVKCDEQHRSRSKIKRLFKKGKMDELERLLGRKDGRIDMRGFPFSNANQVIDKFSFKVMDIVMVNKPSFRRRTLRSFDFTEADLTSTVWEHMVFEDCLFDRTVLWDVNFTGCDFIDSRFKDCEIEHTFLGGSDRRNLGSFVNTTFSGGVIRNSHFNFPRIENCVFDCDIEHVDFFGSQFIDCRFTGRLEDVSFRGKTRPRSTSKSLSKIELPENRMINIDFTEAWFDGVNLTHGLDISRISLPRRNRLIFIKNGPEVMAKALQIVEERWSGEERRLGIGVIRNMSRLFEHDQVQLLRNVDDDSDVFGEPFAMKLSELINEVNGR